jgi:hypothetical protein
MTKDQTRQVLSDDVVHLRQKATYYASLNLFEAQKYAERLASNIELALTTLPSDEDPQVSRPWSFPRGNVESAVWFT